MRELIDGRVYEDSSHPIIVVEVNYRSGWIFDAERVASTIKANRKHVTRHISLVMGLNLFGSKAPESEVRSGGAWKARDQQKVLRAFREGVSIQNRRVEINPFSQ